MVEQPHVSHWHWYPNVLVTWMQFPSFKQGFESHGSYIIVLVTPSHVVVSNISELVGRAVDVGNKVVSAGSIDGIVV